MAMSDPLADMLTRVRNACMVKFESVDIPHSNLKTSLAKVLKDEGYINDYHIQEDSKQGILRIDLKYDQNNEKVITGIRRISKPGCRVYVKSDRIPTVMSGLGIGIISTSKGLMTDHQARKNRVGGELLCELW
jgi:small subunit ribosomal protein S8